MKTLTLTPSVLQHLEKLGKPLGQLFVEGTDEDLLALPRVAVVGSRKPTPYGIQVTEKLCGELARAGVVIISGLAFGVDITAHKACLGVGGKTIAVLPSGLENIYPASHGRIAKDITHTGLLVSEYGPTHVPRSYDFLSRNRLIAGLSDFVIVTEATIQSGSLNTAQHAKAMGIPVGAVPGPITNQLSAGAHSLIQGGAHLITSAQDVLDILKVRKKPPAEVLVGATEVETAILQALEKNTTDVTGLALQTGIDAQELLIALTMLEIHQRIQQDTIGNWHLL